MGVSSPTSHSTLCVTPAVCGSCADGIGRHTERRISAPRAYDHNLGCNLFEGNVDLTHLPSEMENLKLNNNLLFGAVDLSCLPHRMFNLHLSDNSFTGRLKLDSLPETLETLHCKNNCFSGEVCFDNLPPRITVIHLFGNPELEGVLDKSIMPQKLFTVSVEETNIDSTLFVHQ